MFSCRDKSTALWAWHMHKESCPFSIKIIKGQIQLNTPNNINTVKIILGVTAKRNKPKALLWLFMLIITDCQGV